MDQKLFFSKSTGGFYDSELHAPEQIPADAVEISREAHAALMAAQYSGKAITGDEEGNPVAIDPPGPSYVELLTARRKEAQAALEKSDITVLRCYENGKKVPKEWVAYRNSLRGIVSAEAVDLTADFPQQPERPEGV